MTFSELLKYVSFDILRIGLDAYGDLLAHYRGLFRIAVAVWVVSIALDAIQSDGSFRPTLWRLIRGSVVIAYLAHPAVPHAFVELMAVPSSTSGVVLSHVTDSPVKGDDFGAALDGMLDKVGEKTKKLTKTGYLSLNIFGFLTTVFLYLFLIGFLAIVLYVAALATFFQAALLFLLPLAVSLYPWSYTRPLFDGLIRQGLSFSLVIPLLNVLVAMVTSPLMKALGNVQKDLPSVLPFCCLCVVGALLALQIPAVASGVGGGVGVPIIKLSLPRLRRGGK